MTDKCIWTHRPDIGDAHYESSCGMKTDYLSHTFIFGGNLNFCPNCGKPVEYDVYIKEIEAKDD